MVVESGRDLPLTFPFTPGSDFAGSVVDLGDNVVRFGDGDRVISTFTPDWVDGLRPAIRWPSCTRRLITSTAVRLARSLSRSRSRLCAGRSARRTDVDFSGCDVGGRRGHSLLRPRT
ncbi:MAG: alcohol dehydrogenase catalytic domain-containing protein [Mycobacterium sp.]